MGHEAKLFTIANLTTEIKNERVKLITSIPQPDSHAHSELLRKIAQWERTIQNFQRDLKSQSHFNQIVFEHNRFGAGGYASGQRLKNQDRNLSDLSDALVVAATNLTELAAALWAGPSGEARALDGIKRSLSNWQKAAKSQETGIFGPAPQELQASIRQLEQTSHRGAAPTNANVIDIFTLMLSLFVLIKSLKDTK